MVRMRRRASAICEVGLMCEAVSEKRPRLRRVPPVTHANKLRRMVWRLVQGSIYAYSPVQAHAWRRMLLRLFGGKIGPGACPYPTARIWAPWNLHMGPRSCLGPGSICYAVGDIVLEEGALVSQGAHLCAATHEHRDPSFPLVIGDIRVGSGAWIAADAFVGPGVVIGTRAVIGARAVVFKDVPPNAIMVGNPARNVGNRKSGQT